MNESPQSLSDSRTVVSVALGPRSYDIVITTGELDRWGELLNAWAARRPDTLRAPGKAIVVSDRHAGPYGETAAQSLGRAGWQVARVELEPGEQTKSISWVSRVYDALVENRADRRTVIVAAGGGVVGDTAGFAAATYARGLPLVQIPTTLLAQVDSSVGGKVGVNHPQGKNLIGAFHQPIGVFIDTLPLGTLPAREYRCGLAEVVKYGVILDGEFFEYLELHRDDLNRQSPEVLRHVIARSCRLKADVVEQDEFETTGLRAILNYGHTFAHAYEALTGYGELLHGEAVAIGMIHASRLAERLGRIDASATRRQVDLLNSLGLPTRLPEALRPTPDAVLDRMWLDKKAVGGELRFVLPTRIGHVELVGGIPVSILQDVLADVLA